VSGDCRKRRTGTITEIEPAGLFFETLGTIRFGALPI
jgi:hypothetical protein